MFLNKKYLFLLVLFFSVYASAESISLNGEWQFTVDSTASFNIEDLISIAEWRTAEVPLSIQAQFEDLRDFHGISWYRKTFSLPGIKQSEVVLIKFHAVDYIAKVFINSKLAGVHEGGYTPFEFDITSLIQNGENEVVVRVMDPADNEEGTEGISYYHIPHGKQNWYIQNSGLWQPVELLIKPALHIKQIHLTPALDGSVDTKIFFSKVPSEQTSFQFYVYDSSGKEVFYETKLFAGNSYNFSFQISSPDLWSFDEPNLYSAEIIAGDDKLTERFGFRSIEAKDKKFYLNGEPFYLMAALDQDFYPETIYSTPSEEFIRDEMLKAKKLGLNMLRCHIKVPDPVYLKVADEVGLLVWYEIPNWDVFTFEAAKRGEKLFDEMLKRDWNHPSLVVLSIINESWGIDLQQKEQRDWLLKVFNESKEKAKGRLVVDNSACWGNFHLKTDINDYHTYWAIPENRHRFDETVKDVEARPDWLFSGFGDSQETGEEPLMISEFGNWGLPKLEDEMPWWLKRGFGDVEVSLPEGVEQRFNEFKYHEVFGSYNELADESQRAQFASLKYEIESIRLLQEIQGYVITEFTDLNWESNGLLDMWRNFKNYSDELSIIQQQDIIIPRPERYTYNSNSAAKINLWISHYSNLPFKDLILKWQSSSGESGTVNIPEVKRTEVKEISSVILNLKQVEKAEKNTINFELADRAGNILAKNFVEVFVFPAVRPNKEKITIHDPGNHLKSISGYLSKSGNSNDSEIIITNLVDELIINQLNEGAAVLCLTDSATKLPESFPFEIISRDSAEWMDGNWASNLNWIRNKQMPFKNISFGSRLGFEGAHSSPWYIITGIPADKFSDVLSGMYVGWLHLSSAYMVQMNAGKGKIIFCTYPVNQNVNSDPYAQSLLNQLIEYSKSSGFNPGLNWKLN